jgi:imidazoleglycerol-phosphate dehydratase
MSAPEHVGERSRSTARVAVHGSGEATAATGVPVLDHLIGLLAEYSGFDIAIEVEPGGALDEVVAAGRALGEGLAGPLAVDARRHGYALVPADEALASVALEVSGRPLVVSNVDLSEAHVGGLGSDLVARFLEELARGAGLTLHVRLLHGEDTQHVLESIFKALGAALRQAAQREPGRGG